MGKGNKKPPVVKDGMKRINFLYQAATITLATNPRNAGLARFYIDSLGSIAQKQLLKLDPSIKRTICKCCHSLLIPGITSKVRTRAKRESHIVVTCIYCNNVKRFLSRKDFISWKSNDGKEEPQPTNTNNTPKTKLQEKKANGDKCSAFCTKDLMQLSSKNMEENVTEITGDEESTETYAAEATQSADKNTMVDHKQIYNM